MKRTYYLFLLFALILTGCEKSGEQEIPSEDEPVNILDSTTDAWFRDYCLSYYDADHNGEVSPEEVAGVTSLDFSRRSCTSLSGIEYFTGLTMLDVRWSDLEDIDLSANTAITDFKARSCQSLVSADLSGTAITHLSRDVLASCRALVTIVLPTRLEFIGQAALSGCSALQSVEIPEGVTDIIDLAFENCVSLTSISFPEAMTSIRSLVMKGCKGLETIYLPSGITSVGGSAFAGCTAVMSVTCAAVTPPDVPNLFADICRAGHAYVPAGRRAHMRNRVAEEHFTNIYCHGKPICVCRNAYRRAGYFPAPRLTNPGRRVSTRHQFHLFAYARLDGLCRGACRCGCQQYGQHSGECLHRLHLSYEFVGSGNAWSLSCMNKICISLDVFFCSISPFRRRKAHVGEKRRGGNREKSKAELLMFRPLLVASCSR